MSIINRRNALFGWAVWKVTKMVARMKARAAVPGTGRHAGLNKSAIASIAAAAAGAVWFWRKKTDESPAS